MVKKLTLLAMAVAAIAAFAIPAAASAATVTGAEVNSVIHGVSTNATTATELGTLECEEVTINGELTENGPTITADGVGVGSTRGCKIAGSELTVTNPTLVHLSSTGPTSGTASLSFVGDLFGGLIKCTYTGTVAVTYSSGGSSIHLNGPLSSGCGAATFNADFAITVEGSPVEID